MGTTRRPGRCREISSWSPAAGGLVVTARPEGDYILRPAVFSADASGGSTLTELRPVHLKMGCRQVVDASPHVVVSVASPAPCTGAAAASFAVTTDSEQV